MNRVKCSLCPQTFEEDDPKIFNIQKERHELGMHSTGRVIYSERTGSPSKPMGNHIYGKVKWISVCKHDVPHDDECTQCLIKDDLLLI